MKTIDPKSLIIHVDGSPPESYKGDKIAIDTEFAGMDGKRLHRPHGKFSGMGCTFDGNEVWIITEENKISQFMKQLDVGTHIYHNAKFDVGQIRRYCDYPDRKLIWDTMIMEQIMYAGWYSAGEFSLADLSRRYLDFYMDKSVREQFETSDGEMTPEQIEYLAVDIVTTWRVYQEQKKIADENDLNIWKNVDRGAMYSVLKMNGMKLNVDAWMELYKFNLSESERIQAKYGKEEPVGKKHKWTGINLNSPAQVKKALSDLGYNRLESTDEKSLAVIVNECEFAKDVLEYRGYAKAAKTYGANFVEEHVEKDGRIYSDFYVNGAACLPAGELVLTSLGYVPTEKVEIGEYVISHNGIPQQIIDVFPNKISPIIKVTTSSGLSLRCSDNHPFLVSKGGIPTWVQAKNLLTTDLVYIQNLCGAEEWRKIPQWEDFSVSSWGRVINNHTGRILKQYHKGRWGHLKVQLYRYGEQKRGENRKDFPVHRLVCLAFLGESNLEVRHLNGIAWDNSVGNLVYGTASENRHDAVIQGTMLKRNIHETSISEDIAEYIRNREYKKGDDTKLAKEYGVSREYIRDIRKNKRFKLYEQVNKSVEFMLDKISSVVWDGMEMVYGITVETDHSHITSGIVTHNTGRFSSSKPNVENIPVRDGNQFRECFVAQDDYVLVDADFSTQEPRVWSYLADDKLMQDIFRKKQDIYIASAKLMFDWELTKEDPRRQTRMKPTVLGAIFGLTEHGLLRKDQIPLEEGKELLDAFWDAYPASTNYRDEIKKTRDYVQTIYGRKYWLNIYQFGYENNCLNSPVQGSAADITKISGYRFQQEVEKAGYSDRVWLINYIHDELLVECHRSLLEWAIVTLERVMVESAEQCHEGVPAKVGVKFGQNWAEAHG